MPHPKRVSQNSLETTQRVVSTVKFLNICRDDSVSRLILKGFKTTTFPLSIWRGVKRFSKLMKYEIIITIWFAVSLLTFLLFKFIPKKMKEIADPQSKNSLYTILIFIGVPLLLASILTPAVFLIGDKNMDDVYRIVWGGLCLAFVAYFFYKQVSKTK